MSFKPYTVNPLGVGWFQGEIARLETELQKERSLNGKLRSILVIGEAVARHNWGTSCSESYHNSRMATMDTFRNLILEFRKQPAEDSE